MACWFRSWRTLSLARPLGSWHLDTDCLLFYPVPLLCRLKTNRRWADIESMLEVHY